MQAEQYHAAEETVTISKDRTVSLSLKAAFATLKINTVPGGLPISFGGEQQGKGPMNERVDPGVYEVTVETACYALTGERIVLNEGDSRSLTITPPVREAGVEISVTDEAGNAVRATVYADGVEVGSAPGQVVVPLCTKELKVEAADGLVWTGITQLREGEYISLPVVTDRVDRKSRARYQSDSGDTKLDNIINQGWAFYDNGNVRQAKRFFEAVVLQFPESADANFALAYVVYQSGGTENAKLGRYYLCKSAELAYIGTTVYYEVQDMIKGIHLVCE
jgi:hypothetical protein